MLEGVALLLLAVSALLFQRSATAPWVEARVADGRRIQVSPIGIVDFGLGTSGTAPTECRWWPKLGSEELCAETPGGARAMASLRRAYPFVVVALWTAILGIFLTALRIPHVPRAAGVVIAASLPILAMVAMRGVWVASSEALAALAGLSLQPLAAGFGSIVVGAICSAAAAVLLILSGRLRRD
jgi:hypothetical protein